MAALSADTPRDASPGSGTTAQVVNADVAYLGGIAALCTSSHGTSASRGRTEPFSGVAGQIPAGFFSRASTMTFMYQWSLGELRGQINGATPGAQGGTRRGKLPRDERQEKRQAIAFDADTFAMPTSLL